MLRRGRAASTASESWTGRVGWVDWLFHRPRPPSSENEGEDQSLVTGIPASSQPRKPPSIDVTCL